MWDDKNWKMREGVSLILVTDSWRIPSWWISPPNTPGPNTPTVMTKKGKQGPSILQPRPAEPSRHPAPASAGLAGSATSPRYSVSGITRRHPFKEELESRNFDWNF